MVSLARLAMGDGQGRNESLDQNLRAFLFAFFYLGSNLILFLFRTRCTIDADDQPRAGYLHAGQPLHWKELEGAVSLFDAVYRIGEMSLLRAVKAG